MNQKRYAIVRVDKLKHCPIYEGITGFCRDTGCDDCHMRENYGDTKEQLEQKIAQVILKAWLEDKLKPNCEKIPFDIAVAKEIVEFLGVEE